MSLSYTDFLKHILDEINFVISNTENLSQLNFNNDEILTRAVIRSLEIIGEACKKLPEEFRAKYPHIDWKEIAGTRDKLIHNYFGVDYDIVWDIIQNELPELKTEVSRILNIEHN
jgi:uncharacterized protein with HEPN domain